MDEATAPELRPLLANGGGNDIDGSRAVEELLRREGARPGTVARAAAWEARNLWRLSWASVAAELAKNMLLLTTQMFAGRLGPRELAAAAITAQGVQTIAFGFLIGMAGAVQTVCGQAFGARKHHLLGAACQRAVLLLVAAAAFALVPLMWHSGALLRAAGQPAEAAALAQRYARSLCPAVLGFAAQTPLQLFLMAQGVVAPVAGIAAAALALHLAASWLLVRALGLGLPGAGLALGVSYWALALCTAAYIVLIPACKGTWTGLSRDALRLRELWAFAKLALASTLTLALEMWYVPGIGILASYLANPEVTLGATSICISYVCWVFMIMLGLGNAASVRVGNELGAGHQRVARLAVGVACAAGLGIGAATSALFLAVPAPLATLFTGSDEVVRAVARLSPLLALASFLSGLQPVLAGVAIASGWQHSVARVNVAAYYLVGVPAACVLGFRTSLGAAGLWWGMIVGLLAQVGAVAFITCRVDWSQQVEKAAQRLRRTAAEEAAADGGI